MYYCSLDVVIVLNIRSYKKWLTSVRCFVSCAYDKLRIVWVEERQPKIQPFYIYCFYYGGVRCLKQKEKLVLINFHLPFIQPDNIGSFFILQFKCQIMLHL